MRRSRLSPPHNSISGASAEGPPAPPQPPALDPLAAARLLHRPTHNSRDLSTWRPTPLPAVSPLPMVQPTTVPDGSSLSTPTPDAARHLRLYSRTPLSLPPRPIPGEEDASAPRVIQPSQPLAQNAFVAAASQHQRPDAETQARVRKQVDSAYSTESFDGKLRDALEQVWNRVSEGRVKSNESTREVLAKVEERRPRHDDFYKVIRSMYEEMHWRPPGAADRNDHVDACASCGVMLIPGTMGSKKNVPFEMVLEEMKPERLASLLLSHDLRSRLLPLRTEAGDNLLEHLAQYHGAQYYGLYKHLVTVTENGEHRFKLCGDCNSSVRAHKTPKHSFASGLMFFFDDLPVLSDFEKIAISFHRIYDATYKLKKSSKRGPAGDGFTGHFVAFEHDAPEQIAKFFDVPPDHQRWLSDRVKIRLLGDEDDLKEFKQDAVDDFLKQLEQAEQEAIDKARREASDDEARAVNADSASIDINTIPVNYDRVRLSNFNPKRREYWPLLLRPTVLLRYLKRLKALGHPAYQRLMFDADTDKKIVEKLSAERKELLNSAELLCEEAQDAAKQDNTDQADIRSPAFDASLVTTRMSGDVSQQQILNAIRFKYKAAKEKAMKQHKIVSMKAPADADIGTPVEADRFPFLQSPEDVRHCEDVVDADEVASTPCRLRFPLSALEAPLDDALLDETDDLVVPVPDDYLASIADEDASDSDLPPATDAPDVNVMLAEQDQAEEEQQPSDPLEDLFGITQQQSNTIVSSRSKLVSDYSEDFFQMTFPWLFPLAMVGEKPGSVAWNRKVLFHHSGRFSCDLLFILYAANRLQRMQTSAASTFSVRIFSHATERFFDVVNRNDFEGMIDKAAKDPKSSEARKLWGQLAGCVKTTGARVAGSPEQRSTALSEIYALSLMFGTPALFITVSPDDVNNDVVLRIHRFLKTSQKVDVLRTIDALEADPNAQPADIELRASELRDSRSFNVAQTPGLAALMFHRVIDAFFARVVGVPRGESNRINRSGKTAAASGEYGLGVFGRATAWHTVYECQGKGTLHTHGLLWGCLSPELLGACVDNSSLRKAACDALDSVMTASIGDHAYAQMQPIDVRMDPRHTPEMPMTLPKLSECKRLTDEALSRLRQQQQQQPAQPTSNAADPPQQHADILDDNIPSVSLATDAGCELIFRHCTCPFHTDLRVRQKCFQVHVHTFTCWKNNNAICRMAFPQKAPSKTEPLELLRNLVETNDTGAAAANANTDTNATAKQSKTVASGKIYDVEPVPIEGIREIDAAELEQRRCPRLSDKVSPLEKLGIAPDQRVIVWSLAREPGNGDICPHTRALLAIFGCNCAVLHLGSNESAVAVAFYNSNYMTKDSIKIEHALPVIRDMAVKAMNSRSSADNFSDADRINNYRLQVILNGIHGMCEIPSTMACSILLGRRTHDASHPFSWVFPVQATKMIDRLHGAPPDSLPAAHATDGNTTRAGRQLFQNLSDDDDASESDYSASDISDWRATRSDSDSVSDTPADATDQPPHSPALFDDDALTATSPDLPVSFDGTAFSTALPNGHDQPERTSSDCPSSASSRHTFDLAELASLATTASMSTGLQLSSRAADSTRSAPPNVAQAASSNPGDAQQTALNVDTCPDREEAQQLVFDKRLQVSGIDSNLCYAHRGKGSLLVSNNLQHFASGGAPPSATSWSLLEDLTLYEYALVLKVENIPDDAQPTSSEHKPQADKSQEDLSPADVEEVANLAKYLVTEAESQPKGQHFAEGFPARDSKWLRVLAAFRCPRIAGQIIGKVSARTSVSQLDAAARIIGCLLCPWSVHHPPVVRNWDQLTVWFHNLNENNPRQWGFKRIVKSMLSYHASAYVRKMLQSHRMRYADSRYQRDLNFDPNSSDPKQRHAEFVNSALATISSGRRSVPVEADRHVVRLMRTRRSLDPVGTQYATSITLPQGETDTRFTPSAETTGFLQKLQRDKFTSCTTLQSSFNNLYAMRDADDINEVRDSDPKLKKNFLVTESMRQAAIRAEADIKGINDKTILNRINALKPHQRPLFDMMSQQLEHYHAHKDTATPPKIHLQGFPGAGKSYLISVLIAWAEHVLKARPMVTAFTGYAASHISGLTLHRALKLDCTSLDHKTLQRLSRRISSVPFLLVDEVSMVGCEYFSKIIKRLEQLSGSQFGAPGFPALLLVGDFGQLEPVGDRPLFRIPTKSEADEKSARPRPANKTTDSNQQPKKPRDGADFLSQLSGYQTFSKFETYFVDGQVRAAKGSRQAEIIHSMASEGKMADIFGGEVFKFLNERSPIEDVHRFCDAPVVTPTNNRRRRINFHAAVDFGRKHNLPVLVWRKTVPTEAVDQTVLDGFKDPTSVYYEIFVENAPCMLLVNVVPHLSLSNGSSGKMHSLTWNDEVKARNWERVRNAAPGQVIEVDPPEFVNVSITTSTRIAPLDLLSSATSDNGIPSYEHLLPMSWWKIQGKFSKYGKNVPRHESHCVELGFAFTYYKVQGATLNKLVLDLNFPAPLCSFSAVYVGLSRVKQSDDLRLMNIGSAAAEQRIASLSWSPALSEWFSAARSKATRRQQLT